MAVRESNREQEIEMAAEAVCRAILMLRDGEETSIAGLVGAWYRAHGYIFQYVEIRNTDTSGRGTVVLPSLWKTWIRWMFLQL